MADERDPYLMTLDRIEPDIANLDTVTSLASIAISLRRIADALEAAVEIELHVTSLFKERGN